MSGRLVILSKKKWNVWNQDNVERVLRDERQYAEAQQEKIENELKMKQERNYEILHKRGKEGMLEETFNIQETKAIDPEPFRLFDDIEKKAILAVTNEDYMNEKQLKEHLAKKKEGIAE